MQINQGSKDFPGIILAGLPGTGKSQFSRMLLDAHPFLARISQGEIWEQIRTQNSRAEKLGATQYVGPEDYKDALRQILQRTGGTNNTIIQGVWGSKQRRKALYECFSGNLAPIIIQTTCDRWTQLQRIGEGDTNQREEYLRCHQELFSPIKAEELPRDTSFIEIGTNQVPFQIKRINSSDIHKNVIQAIEEVLESRTAKI